MRETELEELNGSVESLTFRRADTGFTVLEMRTEQELVTVVGVLPEVNEGEELRLMGKWDIHPSFGQQFRAELCERYLPATAAAILRYLSSGAVKGVGPATAARIVEAFGDKTLEILEKEPKRLADIRGISAAKAEKIAEEYKKQFSIREAMIFLSNYGMTPSECLRAYKKFGSVTIDIVRENPYSLCGAGIAISFERADAIAKAMDKPADNACRIRAGIVYVLRYNLRNGHTCIPREKILAPSQALLGTHAEEIERQTDGLIEDKQIILKTIGGRDFLFLPTLYQAEAGISNRIKMMLKYPPQPVSTLDADIHAIEKELCITFEGRQAQAIRVAMSKGLLILTGGPGTGKTTTLNGMIRLMENEGLEIALAAPTGRAAKRMSELTGREAKTIHRLLEVEWTQENEISFCRNERNPLEIDALIVDELSMVDVMLFNSLLEAMPLGCRLIMVGDCNQLPPVGAGNVLQDIIASGLLPVVQLTEIFRQAMESLIVTNAHRIVNGEQPVLDKKDRDFFFLQSSSSYSATKLIEELYTTRLPATYNYSPLTDIQILCPSRKGETGTVNLNRLLQDAYNSPEKRKKEITVNGFRLREGDKVMQIKNNYDLIYTKDDGTEGEGVFNGDVGRLEAIDFASGALLVRFEDREVFYPLDAAGDLELAYAVTVHKSQGNEFPAVIMPVLGVQPLLRYRNLLYTAVTRAKNLIILVGRKEEVFAMAENNRKTRRFSALAHFLCEEGEN